jgi:hypothetical protein
MGDREAGPQAANPGPGKTDSGSGSGFEAAIVWLVKSGPKWARVPAICITLLAALSSPILMIRSQFFGAPEGGQRLDRKEPAASQLDMTTSGKVASDEKTVEDAIGNPQLTNDERQKIQLVFSKVRHELQHLNNPTDAAVPWTIFAKKSSNDYFGYKVLPSDQCLLIARVEQGQGTSEWLTDPNRTVAVLVPPQESAPASKRPLASNLQAPAVEVSGAAFGGDDGALHLIPAEFKALIDERPNFAHLPPSVEKTPVQGTCLNPHPGPFAGTWGPYINQCQQPFYRRWNDGCAHVQVFDHCQNVWGPVVWQYCAANHHQ